MMDDHDWRAQVRDALSQLGLDNTHLSDAILREVQSALAAPERTPARVQVLQGGRDAFDDEVEDDDEGVDDEGDDGRIFELFDRDTTPEPAVKRVQVRLSPPGTLSGASLPPQAPLRVGQIRLPANPDVWQTLVHGHTAAIYRVHCDAGELHVAVDGELVVRLEHDQSTDVEGAVVRVRACGDGEALGRFQRLPATRA